MTVSSSTGGSSSSGGTGIPVCNNGILEGTEECDNGPMNSDTADCLTTCVLNKCGDGHVNSTGLMFEECDDGNGDNTDACPDLVAVGDARAFCMNAVCGDGFLRAVGEGCDDGNHTNTDDCPDAPVAGDLRNFCQPASCGDGFVQGGVETCDDGNHVNTDACPDAVPTPNDGKVYCQTAICGDGHLQSGVEQCDTGAATPTCDNMCYLLPRRTTETEPNNTQATATALGAFLRVDGAITPIGDVDYFSFVPAVDSHLTAETTNPADATCGSFDTTMYLFDSAGVQLAYDDDSGQGPCSLMTPAAYAGVRNLRAGQTYYLAVHEYGDNGTLTAYRLTLTLTPNVCGDLYVGGTEGCEAPTVGCNAATCQAACGDGIVLAPAEQCDMVAGAFPPGCDTTTCRTVCGDNIVLAPEQCDDGNTASGDGCSSTCLTEYPTEVEVNDTVAEANPMTTSILGGTPAATDVDIYAFTLTTTSHVRAEVTGRTGGLCPTGADPILDLLASDGTTALAHDDNSADGLCSLITPQLYTGARSLAAGTYYLKVTTRTVITQYLLTLTITPNVCGDGFKGDAEVCDDGNNVLNDGCEMCAPRCGDGIIIAPETCDDSNTVATDGCTDSCVTVCGDNIRFGAEQCDDGNTTAGDGCNATCGWEYSAEVEPNTTTAEADANAHLLAPGITGAITAGDVDTFRVDITVAGSSIRAFTEGVPGACGFDTVLDFLNGAGTILAEDDEGGVGSCSYLGFDVAPDSTGTAAALSNLAVGTYYLQVTGWLTTTVIPAYTLRYQVVLPFCGNGVVNPGEQCDDGNTLNGDTCSSTCTLPLFLTPEAEPNGPFTATPLDLVNGADGWSAVVNLNSAGVVTAADLDYFRFEVPAGPPLSVMAEVSDGSTGCPFDSTLELSDSTLTLKASDLDDGIGLCSLIDPVTDVGARALPPGTYYLLVKHSSATSTQSVPYVLRLRFIPAACGNRIVEAGEQCDDGNAVTGDGCLSCAFEPGWLAEVEPNGTNGVSGSAAPLAAVVTADRLVANVMTTLPANVMGSITSGDNDWFAFDLTAPASNVTIEVTDMAGTGCPGDSYIFLYDALTTTARGTDDDDGRGTCSFLGTSVGPDGSGGADAFMGALLPGRYYVLVRPYFSTTVLNPYRLRITVL